MTERQKMMFAVKEKKNKSKQKKKETPTIVRKTKKSKLFPGVEYPASVDPASLDKYLMPARAKNRINALNKFAVLAGANTFEEVGVNPDNFAAICVWINFRYEDNGLADDHWCDTPRLLTATRALNTHFGTALTPFHYFEMQITMRKYAKKTLSTYSFERGKKRVEA